MATKNTADAVRSPWRRPADRAGALMEASGPLQGEVAQHNPKSKSARPQSWEQLMRVILLLSGLLGQGTHFLPLWLALSGMFGGAQSSLEGQSLNSTDFAHSQWMGFGPVELKRPVLFRFRRRELEQE